MEPTPQGDGSHWRDSNPGSNLLPQPSELRPARERDFDEMDEVDNENVAFPGSEMDSRYADSEYGCPEDDYNSDDNDTHVDISSRSHDSTGRSRASYVGGYDFSAMFGGGSVGSALTPDELDELEFGMLDDELGEQEEGKKGSGLPGDIDGGVKADHFYEEYLDELDGIPRLRTGS